MQFTHEYTDEQLAYLRAAASDNSSYREIAIAFNERFKARLSRNAVLGKLSRMGLRAGKPRKDSVRSNTRVERRAPLHKDKVRRAVSRVSQSPARAPEEQMLRTDGGTNRLAEGNRERFTGTIDSVFDEASLTKKPFLELRRGECRWPASNDASMACGAQAKVGSYCCKHAKIAYRTMPTVSRNRRVLAGAGYLDTEREVTHMLESGGVQAPPLIPSFLPEREDT